jgi:hypothetical protein
MNYRLLFLLLILWIPTGAFAQVSDDFNDGDFTQNPSWTGDETQFTITSQQLKLNSTGTDTSYLVTSSTAAQTAEWQIWVKLSFNPSSGNFGKIYLISDQANLNASLNGYYIQLGGIGTLDDIRLFRQDGLSQVQLIDGPDSTLQNSTNEVRLKVVRDVSGLWTIFADTLGGQNLVSQGIATDNTYISSAYFGVWCKYTSSNATKFYFDDIYAGPQIIDNLPPTLLAAVPNSNNQLELQFDEAVTSASAQTIANYLVNNGIGQPQTALLNGLDPTKVSLSFSTPFTSGTAYQIQVNGLQDATGNTLTNAQANFSFYQVKPLDVVFNEIMPDPSPTQGLPEEEFIELFNKTAFPISLKNWTITAGSSTDILPDVLIQPDSFVVLLSTSAFPYYIDLPNAVEVTGLSYQALTNEGQTLTLRDTAGQIIHSISYTLGWFNDPDKDEGGWSIEQLDPFNPCGGISNWSASGDPSGGTPGFRNSVYTNNPDNFSPEPIKVVITGTNSINVFFNEPLDSSSTLNPLSYLVDNGIGNPTSISASFPSFQKVSLSFAQNFQSGVIYTITIHDFIRDCIGNQLDASYDLKFAIPQMPQANDLVINEILSYPKDGGFDYVELYNRSNKVIDLKDLYIARYGDDGLPETWYQVEADGYLLFGSSYVVITENAVAVKNHYFSSNPDAILSVEDLPSFNIDSGSCVIGDSVGNIVDAMYYDEGMHFPLLQSTKGVSLERLNPERASGERDNWHSAAETVGYGTPAYQNSQYNETATASDWVSLDPPIFSPDNDGYQDVLNILLASETPGTVATMHIYDAKGRFVKNLLENELLGTRNTFTWDGITDRGDKARLGIYILLCETFDTAGNKKKAKKTFVVGGQF